MLGQTLPAATCQDDADHINQEAGYPGGDQSPRRQYLLLQRGGRVPGQQTGNVFYAATRLLDMAKPAGGQQLPEPLGVPNAGRDIYNWTALPPRDTNGVPLPPTGVNADDATAMLRTNVLTELIGAEVEPGDGNRHQLRSQPDQQRNA